MTSPCDFHLNEPILLKEKVFDRGKEKSCSSDTLDSLQFAKGKNMFGHTSKQVAPGQGQVLGKKTQKNWNKK